MTMNAIAIAIGAVALPFLPNSLPNLVGWYRFGMGITSAVNAVSQWNDQSGAGNHLKQSTGSMQPVLQGDGSIVFDGAADFLQATAFTLNQPETVYIRFKHVTWVAGRAVFDGNAGNSMELQQTSAGATPQVRLFAGSGTPSNTDLAVGTYGSVACVFNGASSSILVNTGTPVTGNAGASNAGGFTVGAQGNTAAPSNIQVKEVIVYSVAHNAATQAQVIAYLSTL